MGIADLFRPKWKHSDSNVRAAAVREMGRDDDAALTEVARTDDDEAIRGLAIGKLSDAKLLEEIASSDAPAAVREAALHRASQLWMHRANAATTDKEATEAIAHITDDKALADLVIRSTSAAVCAAALARITDEKALADIVRSSKNTELRREAVGRIGEQSILQSLAIGTQTKEIGFAALDRIEDADTLAAIAKKAKAKGVRARAKKKGAAGDEPTAADVLPDAEKIRHAEQTQLVRTVEDIVKTRGWKRASAMDDARAAWTKLAPYDNEFAPRFDRAVQKFLAERKKYLERIQKSDTEKAARNASRQRATAKRDENAESNDRKSDEAQAGKPAEHRRKIAAPAPAANPETTNSTAAELPASEAAAAAADTAGAPATSELGSDVSVTDANAPSTEAQAADGEQQAADGEQQAADGEQQAADGEQQAAAPRQPRSPEENRARLETICVDLERLVEHNSFRKIENAIQKTEKVFARPGALPTPALAEELTNRYQRVHTVLVAKVRELREADDWRRWANIPKQEALIAQAEALLAATEEIDWLGRLKVLQTDWKQVGAAPKEKGEELWAKFKATCDQIYERSKEQQKQRRDEQKANLNAKRELCERAEKLKESEDWEKTATEIKQLQAQWKRVGPVPRRQSQKIWQRFRAACDDFFERRKPHLESQLGELTENLRQKEEMCEQIEAMLAGFTPESDWPEVLEEVKTAQRRWRDIGPAPRKQSDSIYRRFRTACDGIFQRRDELKDQEHAAELAEQRRAIEELESAVDGDPIQLAEAWTKVRKLDELPPRGALRTELEQRIYDAIEKVLATDPKAFADTELDLDPDATARKKAKLCEKLEELLASDVKANAPAATSAEQMAEQLRNALANNALGGVFVDKKQDPKQAVESARNSWRRLGPVPGEAGATLEERFRTTADKLAPPPKEKKKKKRSKQGTGAPSEGVAAASQEAPAEPKTNGTSTKATSAAAEAVTATLASKPAVTEPAPEAVSAAPGSDVVVNDAAATPSEPEPANEVVAAAAEPQPTPASAEPTPEPTSDKGSIVPVPAPIAGIPETDAVDEGWD